MSTKLHISIASDHRAKPQDVEFLSNEQWTEDAERSLFQRAHEIVSLVRNYGVSLRLSIEINTNEPEQVMFIVNKKMAHPHEVTIKNQNLSIREIEILGLIMQGYTGNQIADKLCISYETVRSHRKHILEKTGAKNTAALINYYHQTFFDK